MKNISEQPLNISAEELMERFVRGDESRTTEGSGLGLSIARDLTELQNGTFDIYLDGDLFKVTVTFPLVENEKDTI
jgi:signal transduction histidine kinase